MLTRVFVLTDAGTLCDDVHTCSCVTDAYDSRYSATPLKVGSFSAGSNVTGVMERVDEITAMLHRAGALACWDYAAAGSHVDIDMNPPHAHDASGGSGGARNGDGSRLLAKDAIFLSPHKFMGGPGSSPYFWLFVFAL